MIKSVEFELVGGGKVTIFLSDTITVQGEASPQPRVYVMDGRHNNGGWQVKDSYDDAVRKIRNAL